MFKIFIGRKRHLLIAKSTVLNCNLMDSTRSPKRQLNARDHKDKKILVCSTLLNYGRESVTDSLTTVSK